MSVIEEMNEEFVEPEVQVAQPEKREIPPATERVFTGQPPVTKKFVRRIDLGDGSGTQVFEADSAEGLIDKLTEAQTHATRKIRDLSQHSAPVPRRYTTPNRRAVAERPSGQRLSEQDRFLITEQPERMVKNLEALQARLDEIEYNSRVERAIASASQNFLTRHREDYMPTPENQAALLNFLGSQGLSPEFWNEENLEYAYEELNSRGLLTRPQSKSQPESRIDNPSGGEGYQPENTNLRPAMGVAHTPEVYAANGQVAADIASLPLEQARSRILALMHQQRQAS